MACGLVWITPDAERQLIYIARVSSSNQDNKEYKKLLKYLIDNKHWSPFESVYMCVEINTTRAISAQILRHRSFTFQELSQRYTKTNKFIIPELRYRNITNRQSSTITHDGIFKYQEKIKHIYSSINDLYEEMINDDVAYECARFILPASTRTRLYMTGSIRSWIHYLQIRTDDHTQKEHQDIANEILEIFKNELPYTYECIFENNNI